MSCQHDEKNFRCVEYVRNYDADTITFKIKGVHPLIGENISIRVNGIDTPEMRTKNKCEKELAKKAKRFVASVVSKAKRIDLKNIKRGKYFRVVADVEVDGESLGQQLLKRGFAYPYDGGAKTIVDWCKRLPASEE